MSSHEPHNPSKDELTELWALADGLRFTIIDRDAEIERLKGLCQDYHSEADSRDAEIEKLHSENSWKQMRIEIQGEAVVKLEAQLAAHREFVKAFDAWEERDLHYVDTALDKARKALEDK